MTEYTVTGIRYVLGEGLDFDERTQLSKDFVKGLKPGTKAILQAEPDNPKDENAVMVFVDYKICGYIGREQCLEVNSLLNEDGQADAVVTRNDEELAFFVKIPGTEVRRVLPSIKERQLPESPLGLHVRIPFTYDVKTLEMLANRIVGMDVKPASVDEFIDMVERYEPLLDAAICNRDEQQMSAILDMLKSVIKRKDELGLSGELLERAQCVHKLLNTRVHNSHRRWKKEYEKKFADHFNRLRANSGICSCLYEMYCESCLSGKKFSEADKDKMRSERKRLLKWFEEMEWSELKNPKDLDKISMKLNYLRVSRFEIYDVFSVLLVLGELDKYLQAAGSEPIEDVEAISDKLPLPRNINTQRAQTYFQKAIDMGYMKCEDGKFKWIGVGGRGVASQLAYFCGLVYGYKHSEYGNRGDGFPEKELNAMFGEERLYSSLTQVYNAQKKQPWRKVIDDMFK